MTGAFSAFASGGVWREPAAILRITDSSGREIYKYDPGEGRPALDPQRAYLINHILSDNARAHARLCHNNALEILQAAAVKTGTTNDFIAMPGR